MDLSADVKKYAPYALGAAGLGLGAYLLYQHQKNAGVPDTNILPEMAFAGDPNNADWYGNSLGWLWPGGGSGGSQPPPIPGASCPPGYHMEGGFNHCVPDGPGPITPHPTDPPLPGVGHPVPPTPGPVQGLETPQVPGTGSISLQPINDYAFTHVLTQETMRVL